MKKPNSFVTPKGFLLYTPTSFQDTFGIVIQSLFKKPNKSCYHFVHEGGYRLDLIDALIEEHKLQDYVGCLDVYTHTELIYEYMTVIDVEYTDVEEHVYFVHNRLINFI